MKGIMFTLTVFIIMTLAIAYFALFSSSSIDETNFINENLASQRIFYTWKGIDDNFQNILEIKLGKVGSSAEFNDTLPSTVDKLNSALTRYQQFISQYINESTISARFEDTSGQETTLEYSKNAQITIKPMNINYTWPTNGKNQVTIVADPSNFHYIQNVTLFINMSNVKIACYPTDPGAPQPCEKWAPNNTVNSCIGIDYCFNLTLAFNDSDGKTYKFVSKYFDVSNKGSDDLNVKNITSSFAISIQVGPLPLVLNINLHNTEVKTYAKLNLTTEDFYIDFPTKLNVSSAFGTKVDFL